jgi:hypothetical protein
MCPRSGARAGSPDPQGMPRDSHGCQTESDPDPVRSNVRCPGKLWDTFSVRWARPGARVHELGAGTHIDADPCNCKNEISLSSSSVTDSQATPSVHVTPALREENVAPVIIPNQSRIALHLVVASLRPHRPRRRSPFMPLFPARTRCLTAETLLASPSARPAAEG